MSSRRAHGASTIGCSRGRADSGKTGIRRSFEAAHRRLSGQKCALSNLTAILLIPIRLSRLHASSNLIPYRNIEQHEWGEGYGIF